MVSNDTDPREVFSLDLFTTDVHTPPGYSQIVDLMAAIPWYEPNKKNSSTTDANNAIRKFTFKANKATGTLEIKPGMFNTEEKGTYFKYPSTREEIIFDTLICIATDQKHASFESNGDFHSSFTTTFSVSGIYQKLREANNGKIKYSKLQIIESLNILSTTHYTLKYLDENGNVDEIKSPLLSSLMTTNRETWLTKQDKDLTCKATFHPLIAREIRELGFRPFRFDLSVQISHAISRAFIKYVSTIFRQIGPDIAPQKTMRELCALANYMDCESAPLHTIKRRFWIAYQEMVDMQLIQEFTPETIDYIKKTRKDLKLTFYPHENLYNSIKKSNAIVNEIHTKNELFEQCNLDIDLSKAISTMNAKKAKSLTKAKKEPE